MTSSCSHEQHGESTWRFFAEVPALSKNVYWQIEQCSHCHAFSFSLIQKEYDENGSLVYVGSPKLASYKGYRAHVLSSPRACPDCGSVKCPRCLQCACTCHCFMKQARELAVVKA